MTPGWNKLCIGRYDAPMTTKKLDPEAGRQVAEELRQKRVQGILLIAAEQGYITELRCAMPECICPKELGGRLHFDPVPPELPNWMPTHDHSPRPKREGGHRAVDNAVLAHRLCNQLDFARSVNQSEAGLRARAESDRLRAIEAARGQSKGP